ncbi:MAG TPA: MBL fold metallo-hydrolase [Gemmataceae bacterium]|nr:MBL fold metallo-hydrolase [Gemmataceae bacterium]
MRCHVLIAASLLLLPVKAQICLAEEKARGLDIYFIDTEGGAATLIVSPTGESVLIDCGNPGPRDAERIHDVANKQAGLKTIDHLIITHWHSDHYGGVERLAKLMPIKEFYDRGIPKELADDPTNFPLLIEAYKKATEGKSHQLKPGDEVPFKQVKDGSTPRLACLCGSGEVVADLAGSQNNKIAKEHRPQAEDKSDNARSLGFLLSYGDFRFLDLGDLTWNIEYKLVHPTDKIGPVDVYQVTHHGLEISNNPVLLKTVSPRVAIFNNGPHKGGSPAVTANLRRLPDIQAIYQMHKNLDVASQENADDEFIANAEEKCAGNFIKLAVAPDSKSYTVTVGAKDKPKSYKTRDK